MEIVIEFLVAFGIVGSIEARGRAILKVHERQLDSIRDELADCNRKLNLLLRNREQSEKPSPE